MYPENLKYTKEHEWAKIEGDIATTGLTHHAQDELGDIVFAELPAVGKEVKQAQEFGVVESVKTVSNLYAPLSGTVTEVNTNIANTPDVINSDPYGQGWMVKLKIKDSAEAEKLLSAEDYKKLIKK